MDKLKKLKKILKDMDSVLVAYSGGLDSSFLLKIAVDVLGSNVLAVTAKSPTYPYEELRSAVKTAIAIGSKQALLNTKELSDKYFIANSAQRCYFCKRGLFGSLRKIAKEKGLRFIVDGSTLSDKNDLRPGNKAKKEFSIRSPLVEAGFTKPDVRRASKAIGLDTWNKPPLACLASRIPYGRKITVSLLKKIEKGESFLRSIGFSQVRLRSYDDICRIEVDKKELTKVINKRKAIVSELKKIGYKYITIDLEGYRTGSMNPAPACRGGVNPAPARRG